MYDYIFRSQVVGAPGARSSNTKVQHFDKARQAYFLIYC